MPKLGYPSQVPFYQPAKLSKVDAVEGDRAYAPPSIDDWRVVERLEVAIAQYRLVRPREVWCLEVWEGAYQDAAVSADQRCRDSGVRADTCSRLARRARWAIDAMIGPVDRNFMID
jgi:hypothetical protein